jgi:hypothetical protein
LLEILSLHQIINLTTKYNNYYLRDSEKEKNRRNQRETNGDDEPEIERSLLGFEDIKNIRGVPRKLI